MLVPGVILGRKLECRDKKKIVQMGNHHTLSHTTTVDHGDQTQAAEVRSEGINYCTLENYAFAILHNLLNFFWEFCGEGGVL